MVKVACVGIGCNDGRMFLPAADRLRSEGFPIEVVCEDSSILDSDLERLSSFIDSLGGTDFCFLQVHGDLGHFRHSSKLLSALRRSGVGTFLMSTESADLSANRDLFPFGDDEYLVLLNLESAGGPDNVESLLRWVLARYGGFDIRVPEPVVPLQQGVYGGGGDPEDIDGALDSVCGRGVPVVAVLFHQKYWLTGNTAYVDAVVDGIRARGAEAVAFFVTTGSSRLTGAIGFGGLVRKHLIRDGAPRVDCVVNTIGFSQTLVPAAGTHDQGEGSDFLRKLDVPVLQAVTLYGPPSRWAESPAGLSASDIVMSVTDPEYDGQIDTFPICGSVLGPDGTYRSVPIPDRCSAVAEMAVRWASLRGKPEGEKKVAIILYMYPPRQDLAGGGYGLDSFASTISLLAHLKDRGYRIDWIPESADELARALSSGVTNDDDYVTSDLVAEKAVDTVPLRDYEGWLSGIGSVPRDTMVGSWGPAPGMIHVIGDRQLLPGIMDGNVFICFQPDRGKTGAEAYHDACMSPPHQYLGFYRWLKYTWGADAVVHMGTHGSLEWLPGKAAGLSSDCFPDLILDGIPNVNPYIIDNPGEGMQAKRRGYAVDVTHLHPAMFRSGGYAAVDELEDMLQSYLKAANTGAFDNLVPILRRIRVAAVAMNFHSDMGFDPECSDRELALVVDDMYDYVLEIKDAMVKDGLHVLGEVPEGKRMCETVCMLVRMPNGAVPSLREAIAEYRGWGAGIFTGSATDVLDDGRLAGEAADEADAEAYSLVESIVACGFDLDSAVTECERMFPGRSVGLDAVVGYICGPLSGSILRMGEEISNTVAALDGRFVPPGPSGCPARGRADILPTGRNFYSIDPDGIPWQSSWEIGSRMAEQMISRYVGDNGGYPREVGIVLWATDVMKTGGDDIAYVLRLVGLRPVWSGYGGRVSGLEVIPLEELGRPRIDVTLRISGLFRDTFPNLCDMLDRGIREVMELDEAEESNYLAANLRRDAADAILAGVPADRAREEAGTRVFGDAPGQYGCGVSDIVRSSGWTEISDIAGVFVDTGCYAYGGGRYGAELRDQFRRRLSGIDVTVKNHNTRTVDMLDMDDDFDSLGGFNAAVTAIRGKSPVSFMGDSSDSRAPRLRTASEECGFVFRSKIDNPKWLEGLKNHGWSGAKELSKLADFTMGWAATSGIVKDWMWDDIADRFVLDGDTRGWILESNPFALQAMLGRLAEASSRGLWNCSEDRMRRLEEIFVETEALIEEITDPGWKGNVPKR